MHTVYKIIYMYMYTVKYCTYSTCTAPGQVQLLVVHEGGGGQARDVSETAALQPLSQQTALASEHAHAGR